MLKCRTIAVGVTNLSDARYFASYDVDWITFPSSREMDNISDIKEIMNWCEGPKLGVEIRDEDPAFADFMKEELPLHGVLVEDDWYEGEGVEQIWWAVGEDVSQINESHWVAVVIDPSAIKNIPQALRSKVYVDSQDMNEDEVAKMTEEHPDLGLVLYGTHEEKVGFKSFEAQEKIIDLLMD